MGCYSYPLFAKPDNIVFLPKQIDGSLTINIDRYTYYIEENIIPNIPITTGNFMQKIIDENECGIKIYGYLLKHHIKAWENLLTEILEQNPKEKKIEFHFYCGEDSKAFYFKAERKQDKIVFEVLIGSDNDGAYNNITFVDSDENEYSIDELEIMNKEDTLKRYLNEEEEENEVMVKYTFDEKKYKIVYNIDGVVFNTYISPYGNK